MRNVCIWQANGDNNPQLIISQDLTVYFKLRLGGSRHLAAMLQLNGTSRAHS